jgi:glucan phosphoethanolaminetransferase (alkaline phosphatase superfamily)
MGASRRTATIFKTAAMYTLVWIAADLLCRFVLFNHTTQPFWSQLYGKSIVMAFAASCTWLVVIALMARISLWLALPVVLFFALLVTVDLFNAYFMTKYFYSYISKEHLIFLAQDLQYFWNTLATYPESYHYLLMGVTVTGFAWSAIRAHLVARSTPVLHLVLTLTISTAVYGALFLRISPDSRHFVLLPSINSTLQSYLFVDEWKERAKIIDAQYELQKHKKLDFTVAPLPMPQLKTVVLIINESWGTDFFPNSRNGRSGMPLLSQRLESAPNDFFVFSQAFTNSTATDVSWPAIFTGVSPNESIDKLLIFPLITNYAKRAGFKTALFSSQRMFWGNLTNFLGEGQIDTFVDADVMKNPIVNDMGSDDMLTVERIDSFLKNEVSQSEPLFLVFGSNALHAPFQISSAKLKNSADPSLSRYEQALGILDHATDRLLESLKETGRFDDALIIMTGDHGEGSFPPNHVPRISSFYDYFQRIPFVVKLPLKTPQAIRTAVKENRHRNVQNIDIAPTLAQFFATCAEPRQNYVCSAFRGASFARPLPEERALIAINTNDVRRWQPEGFGIVNGSKRLVFSSAEPEIRFFNVTNDPHESHNIWPVLSQSEKDFYLRQISNEKHLMRIYQKYR